ncbi:zinc-ribbon domain-containing protein [Microbacterium binotii]
MDLVDTPRIVDSAAQYPRWIQRRPQAVAEWDWVRNDPSSDPWEASSSSKRAWWVCDIGHSWEAVIATRAQAGCPYCAGQSVWPGHNDLRTHHPAVAAEWDDTPGANAGDPDHVGAQSARRATWRCTRGHQWTATIRNRTRLGAGCPYCSGYFAIAGETDLVTLRPDLAAEWDKERNGDLAATMVGIGSSKKAWWTASCGHGWQAMVSKRALAGQNCPYCSRKRVLPGDNDLATVRPDLAAEWDVSNQLRPDQVLPKSGSRATWRCARGHTWETTPHKRSNGRGCPYCAGNRVIAGETDLASVSPEIAKEWSPDNALKPTAVKPFTKRKVKWLCAQGHSWEATVASRSRGVRCPHCRSQNKHGVTSPL